MTQDLIEVRISVPDEEVGDAVAEALVGRGLAACVQRLGPIRSTYVWEGTIEREQEWLLLVKTTAETFEALTAAVAEVHPYEVPEVLAVPVTASLEAYGGWVRNAVGVR